MLGGYDKAFVGKTLKDIRKSLKLTQQNVCDITSLSSETLRRIENGLNLPSFRTISDLSSVYKVNLLKLFSNIHQVNDYYHFYEYLDDLIVHYQPEKLDQLKYHYQALNHQTLELVNPVELKQLELLVEGLLLCYGAKVDFQQSNDYLIQAIQLTIPQFSLTSFHQHKYSIIELRVLFILAVNLSDMRIYDVSNDIFQFVINYPVNDHATYFSNDFIKIQLKAYTNLAYNAHWLDDHNMVIKYSDLGIQLALDNDLVYLLHFAYYRKGIALFHLNPEDLSYIDYLKKSMMLTEIQGMHDYKHIIKSKTYERYGIRL